MSDRNYLDQRTRSAARQKAISEKGRDIAPIPDVVNPERRAQAIADFEFFCRTYLSATFSLAWSNDHRRAIARIETAVREGGLFGYAMPRGSGKTTLAEAASLWATITGQREYVVFIGSDETAAVSSVESLKTELETNDLLLEDFPEVVYPIRCLEGIPHRCNGQTFKGERTHIGWTANEIVYPSIPGSKASGSIITGRGLTGRIRGMAFKRPDGRKVRPALVIVDDPQTDESARSPSQCDQRERILSGAVLGLSGPGRKIAGIMPCTVIAKGDLADRILDRQKHPEWQGERCKMLYAFPADERLWNQYADIRAQSLRSGNGGKEATEFYRANREAMDRGAEAAWPVRFNPDELSAVQCAMNLKLNDERAFFAEYQNEPLVDRGSDTAVTVDEVKSKKNGVRRGEIPVGCDHLTAYIDVQGKLLYWLVAGWGPNFTGSVVDYGAFPEQHASYYTLATARKTLQQYKPKAGLEGQLYAGLEAVSEMLAGREWKRQDGAMLRLSRALIDANWGKSTDTVYLFCRQSKYAGIFMPSHGKYVGAGQMPWEQYTRKAGELIGNHWMLPSVKGKRAIRHCLIDTNYWKSFIHARLSTAMGDHGCLSLYGAKNDDHQMIAEQVTSEYSVRTEGRGRVVDEWHLKPGDPDNHWFDCLCGSAVAASMCGCALQLAGAAKPVAKPAARRQRVSYL